MYEWLDGERPVCVYMCVCVYICMYICMYTHTYMYTQIEYHHHRVNISFAYELQITNIWLLKWPSLSNWTFFMIFLRLSWVFLTFFPSEVFLFPLYSAPSLVLCRLNVRERMGCCQVGEAKGKRFGQPEENFKNSCDYCHLQT